MQRDLYPPDGLYWVAVRGPAMPAWPHPTTETVMRRAIVRVGTHVGQETIWYFGEGAIGGAVRSNYEYLIGYRTIEQQQAAQTILLNGTIDQARAEVRRAAMREDVVIRREARNADAP
jgi:hypothetical protein